MVTRTDHFSKVARAYAEYRPRYPAELFDFVSALTPQHRRAWDCGAGSGQATEGLLPYYSSVVATDISRSQLGSAPTLGRLYRVAAAGEHCPLGRASVDLVVVAQALHWIDRPAFYAEVRRVVEAGGAIVVWSYDLAVLGDPALDSAFRDFYDRTLGQYWPPERRLVDDRYRGIEFPFEEMESPEFSMVADWTLEELLGYVGTWSAVNRYRASQGHDPGAMLGERLEPGWARRETRRIRWPLTVRAGRV